MTNGSTWPRRGLTAGFRFLLFVNRQSSLENQHSVPIAVEPVAFGDGGPVGVEDEFTPREGAHQDEERGLRQMEVREQAAQHPELEAGVDEQLRLASRRDDLAIVR